MTFRGRIQGGVVVLEEPTSLADGTAVRIEPVDPEPQDASSPETLSSALLRFAGKAVDLPPDASTNHDHYLYGTPKREK